MLEFYLKYYPEKFEKKATQLVTEIELLLSNENIEAEDAEVQSIKLEYQDKLKQSTYNKLNNLYFTLRKNQASNHPLLKKYLPELKVDPVGQLQFGDFFSGAGGLSEGLVNAGFEPAFVNDHYLDALETYYFNHFLSLERFYNGDIKEFADNIEQYKHLFKDVKLIAGGPPCQGFSMANRWNFTIESETKLKRFIEDERNVLYKYFVNILGKIRPDFFIIENVSGMAKAEQQIEEDIQTAAEGIYSFIPLILDAQNFDVPQRRKRYFLIGCRDFIFIERIKENLKSFKSTKFKLVDALFGLPIIGTNPNKLNTNYESEQNGYTFVKKNVPVNDFIRKINYNLNFEYVLNHKSRYNNDNDLKIFSALPEGENSLHPSIREFIKYKNRDHIFKDKYYKLKHDEVSKTITSHMRFDCHMYIHPTQARGLSPREAARLQTFPDHYFFRGTLNSWYKQIGNAVPVKLAKAIGDQIITFYK